MKRNIFITVIVFAVLLSTFLLIRSAETKNKSYYSGDAISFAGKVYVGSTNSGYLEVYRLDEQKLNLISRIKNNDTRFGEQRDFFDFKFSAEDGNLFVYAISEYNLFKFQIKGNSMELVSKNKNTYWEWYSRVDKFGSNIVTISAQGVKIWNKDLQVIDSYKLENTDTPYNLRASNDRFITNVEGDYLKVYDREKRDYTSSIALNFWQKPNNHKSYQDYNLNTYVVDDYYAKKFSPEGKLIASFKHLDHEGFDVSSNGNDYIYFSNGMGIVKLLAKDMSLKDFAYTYKIAGEGGWAMGLNALSNNGHDVIVVFNNTNILVLDHNLKKLASVTANEKEDPYPQESLYLKVNNNSALPGAMIELNGGGFLPEENLKINFAGTISEAKADNRGRFNIELKVPEKKAMVDIKVDGLSSALTYSTSFSIIGNK